MAARLTAALAAAVALAVMTTADAANRSGASSAGRCFERAPVGKREPLAVRLIFRDQRLGHVTTGAYGYEVDFHSNRAADAKLALFVSGKLARRLDPGGRGPVRIAGGTN